MLNEQLRTTGSTQDQTQANPMQSMRLNPCTLSGPSLSCLSHGERWDPANVRGREMRSYKHQHADKGTLESKFDGRWM